ncbi:DUF4239 domain-containing protein [Rhizobium sp. FKL33]|uniref:bestrophin-like domain n=1 Tax=Rhizobium sp. FKL33 TaxID=2562307 RepID=UPI0010BFDDDB|nr:DUF4239 domain-containing protein [Rhizobium sp. FKL33]
MITLIYNTPPAILGIAFVLISAAISVIGVEIVGRIEPLDLRHTYNDIVGFVIAVVGVVYAVLLASVAISAWESYDKSVAIVEREAGTLGDIARLAQGLPPPNAAEARRLVLAYADTVVKKEWPTMLNGERPSEAWPDVRNIQTFVLGLDPKSPRDVVLQEHLLTSLTDLFDVRRERMAMADYGINGIVWTVVIVGSFTLIGVCLMFGLEKRRHQILCSFLSVSTALVIFMIIEMDRPFLGAMGVSSYAIEYTADIISNFSG